MKFLIHTVWLLTVIGLVSTLAACGVSKDEHEKIVSERNKAVAELADKKDELDKTKFELEKTKTRLNQVNQGLAEKKNSLAKTDNQIRMALEKCSQEKRAMQSSLIATRREVKYFRDKMEELINSFNKVSNDLNLAKKANEILRQQIDELTTERDRLKKLVRN